MVLDLRQLAGDVNYDAATGNVTVTPATSLYAMHQTLAAAGRGYPRAPALPSGRRGTPSAGAGRPVAARGLLCDALRSATVVLPGGQAVTTSATSQPDLFWGCGAAEAATSASQRR